MQFLKKVYNWLVVSSADPTKVSLTVKGFLHTAAGVLLVFTPLFHLNIGQTKIDEFIDLSSQLVIAFYAAFSALVTLFGFFRKIYNTATQN